MPVHARPMFPTWLERRMADSVTLVMTGGVLWAFWQAITEWKDRGNRRTACLFALIGVVLAIAMLSIVDLAGLKP